MTSKIINVQFGDRVKVKKSDSEPCVWLELLETGNQNSFVYLTQDEVVKLIHVLLETLR